MMRALFSSATGMLAQQVNVDMIANNLANVNTNGFKKARADFQDLLYQTLRLAGATVTQGAQAPTGIEVGMGVRLAATTRNFAQGEFQQTDNPFDLAVEGAGFFRITLPDGTTAYTRDGAFKVDGTGKLVTSDGFTVDPPITIPQGTIRVNISKRGVVEALVQGQDTPQNLGQLQLANFINPAGLASAGGNLFRETPASGNPTTGAPGENGLGTIGQGVLEKSNVQVVEELVSLITAQRAYEINSKAIQTADEMLATANNLRR